MIGEKVPAIRLSIITINFNNAGGLSRTLASVAAQTDCDLEHIVVDGSSGDGSAKIIADHAKRRLRNVEIKTLIEPDTGIYNAMNKGLKLVTGDYVAFLNSGDRYCSDRTASIIQDNILANGRPPGVYGNKLYSNPDGKIVRYWRPGPFRRYRYLLGWMTPHLTTIIRRDLYDRHEHFDESFKIASDYELMFRMFYKSMQTPVYVNSDIVEMESGGISNAGWRNVLLSNLEVVRCWRKNTRITPYWLVLFRPVSKIPHLILGRLRNYI